MGRLEALIHRRLWPARRPTSRLAGAALTVGRYTYGVLRELFLGEISLRAMGLVYTTILAIVPLLAFSFSVAKGLGLHRQMEPLLREFLQPVGPRADEITANVVQFVDNVSGSVLAVLSIALLLVTAMSMAQKVEASFNYVWRVDRPRSLVRRIGDYMSVILLGPIVMIVATTAITTITTADVVQSISESIPLGGWIGELNRLAPYLLVVIAFAALYMLIPNTQVRIKPALIGSFAGGIAWVSAGRIFAATIVNSTRLEAVYSGFAIVIILMIWLHLSWLILLLGSQLAYYVQYPFQLRQSQRSGPVDPRTRERLAFAIMITVARDFESPGHGWREESLASELRIERFAVKSVLAELIDDHLLVESAEQRLLPARDPRRIALAEILAAVRGSGARPHHADEPPWDDTVEAICSEIDQSLGAALADKTLADVLDLTETAPAEQTPN